METQDSQGVSSVHPPASQAPSDIPTSIPTANATAARETDQSHTTASTDHASQSPAEKNDKDSQSDKRPNEEQPSAVNPITKKIKLFSGNFDDASDDDDDSDSDIDMAIADTEVSKNDKDIEVDSVRTNDSAGNNNNNSTEYHKHGFSIPSNSELFKKNDALKTYTNFVQDSSSYQSQTSTYSQLSSIPLNLPAPQFLPPNIQLLINTIPSLDNLATQILRIIVQSPYQKILDLVANPETLPGMTYQTLISLFDNIKSLYSTEDPFLSVEHLTFGLWKENAAAPTFFRGKEATVQSTLRKVNLATFLNATLGTIDTGFFYLNESFLDVFCPDQALDPQANITNLSSASAQIYDVATLSSHSLSSSAGKLLKSQTVLYLELKTQAYISALEAHERSREDIANDIFPDNLNEILLKRKSRLTGVEKSTLTPSETDFIARCKKRKENLLQAPLDEDLSEQYDWLTFLKDFFEFARKHIGYLVWGSKNLSEQTATKTNAAKSSRSTPTAIPVILPSTASTPRIEPTIPDGFKYDSDSLPSEIVQQHREATYSNTSVKHLNRRLWTKTEELALKEALQQKGPQWSQILEMHGAGGSISEALKNRSQVQLKDKARNWKIFFLKNGLPLPDYLQRVTGDLESSKNGPRRNKRAADAKRTNKPPRIEQRHLDAANAAAAAKAEETAETKHDIVAQKSNEVPQEANIFAQKEFLEQEQDQDQQQQQQSNTDKAESDNKESKDKEDEKQKSPPTKDVHHDVDEDPDYDNILKDLINQATTDANHDAHTHHDTATQGGASNSATDAEAGDQQQQHLDDDVQRFVEEVMNSNKKKVDKDGEEK